MCELNNPLFKSSEEKEEKSCGRVEELQSQNKSIFGAVWKEVSWRLRDGGG